MFAASVNFVFVIIITLDDGSGGALQVNCVDITTISPLQQSLQKSSPMAHTSSSMPTTSDHSNVVKHRFETTLVHLKRIFTNVLCGKSSSNISCRRTTNDSKYNSENISHNRSTTVVGVSRSVHGIDGYLRFISSLEPLVEMVRVFAKHVYVTYNWYHPEFKLGKCMMKYAHIQYPEIMQRFRLGNFAKIGQSLFFALVSYIKNVVSGPIVSSQYDDAIDRARIGMKIEQITSQQKQIGQQQNSYSNAITAANLPDHQAYATFVPSSTNFNYYNLLQQLTPDQSGVSVRYERHTNESQIQISDTLRRNRDDELADRASKNVMQLKRLNYWLRNANQITNGGGNKRVCRNLKTHSRAQTDENIMHTEQRQSLEDLDAFDEGNIIDSDAIINLTNETAENAVDDLFNIEPTILESLGIEANSIKRWTPMYCAKEYAIDLIKRFTHSLLFG